MITTVLIFALITAAFELLLLLKFASGKALRGRALPAFCHTFAIAANLAVHWGTIVGTMTAITAGLVSFATVPLAVVLVTFWENYREKTNSSTT